jgi:2-dehydropantoate 2-reductase
VRVRVGVFGAGAIGSYLGGQLAASGTDVVLLGRAALHEAHESGHMFVVDLSGTTRALPPRFGPLRVVTDAAELASCDVILVTVKSRDTETAAATLARVLPSPRTIASFQNGVDNPARLRAALPTHEVLAGMVSFNVVWEAPATFRRGTSGPLALARGSAMSDRLQAALEQAGLATARPPDMLGVQWGKLVLNLNNAVNALSGLPLAEQLRRGDYRRVAARAMAEGRAATTAAGIRLRGVGKMLPNVAPFALALPDRLFSIVARPMLKVDAHARSSMWEDLERRRPTEVDDLNGAVVRLGARCGVPTPVNERLVQLVKEAEARGEGSPRLSASALLP